ncbi:sulfurtransferase [Siminovitchia sediminis]|uniref:Sulfurtransferase n=1 Tax=Siminovitchia sediminis TaxID=1274353 RepID=A0ABW4KJH2_9BACI
MLLFIKSKEWLKERLHDSNIRIVDCTYSLQDPSYGKTVYQKKHIPGAVYFDLAKDLSSEVQIHGGRHPLPHIETFREKLEESGIHEKNAVIAYDGGEGCFASRFWWLLTFLGHQQVFVLDGGMKEWEEAQYPLTDMVPFYRKSTFHIRPQPSMLADIIEVKAEMNSDHTVLIDSRAKERYLGCKEPIDVKPGHIPGAVNFEWTESFHEGKWKNKDEQKRRFSRLNPNNSIIVYCGSGVTATVNVLSLLESGFQHVKLYAGSYSDWVSYPENKVETSRNEAGL